MRRECHVPRCDLCRRFGHAKDDCAKTYASVTEAATADETSDFLMDEEEAEVTAAVQDPARAELAPEPPQARVPSDASSTALTPPEADPPVARDSESAKDNLEDATPRPHGDSEDASDTIRNMEEDEASATEMEATSSVVNKRSLDATLAGHEDDEGLPEQRRKWKTVESRRKRINPPPRIPPDDRRRGNTT